MLSVDATAMNWKAFLSDPDFLFRKLEAAKQGKVAPLVPWLRLLRTDAIEAWARKSRRVEKTIRYGDPDFKRPLQILLQRHLLPVSTRRNPAPLSNFWEWALPHHPGLVGLWDRLNLPATLGAAKLAKQESDFAQVLERAFQEVNGQIAPGWARLELERQVATRRGHDGKQGNRACARVVFAFPSPRLPHLRPGALVDFELLAESGLALSINCRDVFGERFLHRLDHELPERVGTHRLRRLKHDWDLCQPRILDGTSGTMALWLAQFFASGGAVLNGRRWSLAPWVVVSAALDEQQAGSGGGAGAVGGLEEKAQILMEEGVRLLLVANEDLPHLAATPDLQIASVGGDTRQLAETAREWDALIPVALDALGSELLTPISPCSNRHFTSRRLAHLNHFQREQHFLVPAYALRALDEMMTTMAGSGYIHITGPAGIGKSGIAYALRERRQDVPPKMRKVLAYSILHGEAESPGMLWQQMKHQAHRLNAIDDEEVLAFAEPPSLDTWQELRSALCQLLRVVRNERCEGQPLLLVLDGLDELTVPDHGIPPLLSALPTPDELPDGCFVLLLSRVELRRGLRKEIDQRLLADPARARRLDLDPAAAHYEAFLGDFLTASLGETVRCHLPALIEQGRNRFLYVRFLRDLLQGQDLSHLQPGQLPAGQALFSAYLTRRAMEVDGGQTRFAQWHLPLLALLGASYEPASRALLRLWLRDGEWSDQDNSQLEKSLEELEPLLREDRAELADDSVFTIEHLEFVNWLKKTKDDPWNQALKNAHDRIVCVAKRPPVGKDRLDNYHLVYHVGHLHALQRDGEAAEILSREEYSHAMAQLSETFRRQWLYDKTLHVADLWVDQLRQAKKYARLHLPAYHTRLVTSLTEALNQRGQLRIALRDLQGAIIDLKMVLALRTWLVNQHIAADQTSSLLINNVAAALINLGCACDAAGNSRMADRHFKRAIIYLQDLVFENARDGCGRLRPVTDETATENLATVYSWRSVLRLKSEGATQEQLHEALAFNSYSRQVQDALVRTKSDTIDLELAREIATNLLNCSQILQLLGRQSEALDWSNRSIACFSEIVPPEPDMELGTAWHPAAVMDKARAHMLRSYVLQALTADPAFLDAEDRAAKDSRDAVRLLELVVAGEGGEVRALRKNSSLLLELAKALLCRSQVVRHQGRFDAAWPDIYLAWHLIKLTCDWLGYNQSLGASCDLTEVLSTSRESSEQALSPFEEQWVKDVEQRPGMSPEFQYKEFVCPLLNRLIALHRVAGSLFLTPRIRELAHLLEGQRRDLLAQGAPADAAIEADWQQVYPMLVGPRAAAYQ
jgi:hypothetical protein